MKLAADITSSEPQNPVKRALESVLEVLGLEISSTDEADLIITDEPSKVLDYLKAGKTVIQFLLPGGTAATGLTTAPLFKDRFFIFGLLPKGDYPHFADMMSHLAELAKKEKEG